MGFPRQEYWSRFPFPSPKNLPDPQIKPTSPALAGGFFTTKPLGKPNNQLYSNIKEKVLKKEEMHELGYEDPSPVLSSEAWGQEGNPPGSHGQWCRDCSQP